jgi:hypothetical protein
VGPRDGLDTEARGKIISPLPGSNLDRPVVQSNILTVLPRPLFVHVTYLCLSVHNKLSSKQIIVYVLCHGLLCFERVFKKDTNIYGQS